MSNILMTRLETRFEIYNWLITWASTNGNLYLIKYLVEEVGVDVDTWSIGVASENGQLPVVKYLVEEVGIDITTNNNYAIRWAIGKGHLPVVKYLIENGADATSNNNIAIIWAMDNCHHHVVKYLLGIDKVRKGITQPTLDMKRLWKEIVNERVQVARVGKHLEMTSRIPDVVINEIKKYM